MSATILGLETLLIAQCRGWMAESKMSVVASTTQVPNPDTLGAIARGMDALKSSPAVFGRPTDAEVAAIARPYLLLDLAEYRLLEAILQNRTKVTETAQQRSKSSSDTGKLIGDRMAVLEKRYARYLAQPLVGGTIDIRSAARCGPISEI